MVRANLSRWKEQGSKTIGEQAHAEVERLIAAAAPSRLGDDVKQEIEKLMSDEARSHGLDALPGRSS